MSINNTIYTTSVQLSEDLKGLQKSPFINLPTEVIQEIFQNFDVRTSNEFKNILLSCKAFLVLGRDLNINFHKSIYNYNNLKFNIINNKNPATLQHLLSKYKFIDNSHRDMVLEEMLNFSMKHNNQTAVKELLYNSKVNPNIVLTPEMLNYEVLEVLFKHPEYKFNGSSDLVRSILNKMDVKLLDLFLKHTSFDPSIENNQPIMDFIILEGKNKPKMLKIVARLLKDPRVNPSADNNRLLKQVLFQKEEEIMDILLEHPKLDLWSKKEDLILWATANNKLLICQKLLRKIHKLDGV